MNLSTRRTLTIFHVRALVFLVCSFANAQRFVTPPSYFNGTEAYSVVQGDFNRDGKLDLAVVDQGILWILLGRGDGSFQTPVQIATLAGSLATADFNRDGNLDLAVTDYINGTVSTLLGNGDGTFQAPMTFPAGSSPISIVAGDFAGKGQPGVAVINANPIFQQDETVSVLLGNGDGTLQTPIAIPVGITLYALAAGDFNNDGKQDLAVSTTNYYSYPFVYLLLSNGNGTFQMRQLDPPYDLGVTRVCDSRSQWRRQLRHRYGNNAQRVRSLSRAGKRILL